MDDVEAIKLAGLLLLIIVVAAVVLVTVLALVTRVWRHQQQPPRRRGQPSPPRPDAWQVAGQRQPAPADPLEDSPHGAPPSELPNAGAEEHPDDDAGDDLEDEPPEDRTDDDFEDGPDTRR